LSAKENSATEEGGSENVARLPGVLAESSDFAFRFLKFSGELRGIADNGNSDSAFVTNSHLGLTRPNA
jgi:hypothetical protein